MTTTAGRVTARERQEAAYREHVASVAASAPPLTDEQRVTIYTALHGRTGARSQR